MSATATLTAIFEAQDRISNTLSGIDRRGNSLTGTFKKVATAAAAAFSTAKIVQFGKECASAAVTFESSMNEVYTLLPGISADAMSKMQADVKDFSKEMGVLTTETVPALYQALSAGVSQDTVFDFLETANKAAVGGVTTLETAVDGLSSVVNAYGEDALSAQMASDLMFTTVKLGKTTFEELAGSLYNVVPTAVGAGVAFTDISAALAAMTAQGVPTSVATTQLRQAIVELSKSGTETDKMFRKLAGKSFKEFISAGGNMQEAFQLLEKHAADAGLGVNDMFGSVEAGNAVLALTGQGTEKFTQAMTEMQSAAGATDAAFGTMEDGMSRKLQKMQAAWEVAKINIGNVVVDALLPIFEFVADNIDDIASGVQTAFSVLGGAIQTVWGIAKPVLQWVKKNPDLVSTALAAIGTAIVTHKVATGITSVAGALKTFNLAFLASPVGIITAIATAVVAIGVACYKAAKKMEKADLAAHFGEITLSAEELESVAKRIIRTDTFGKLEKSMRALDEVESLAEGIQDAIDVMDRAHWKVSVGLELNDSEKEEYRSAVTSFIADTQSILQSKQYQLNLALDFFAGDDETGAKMKENLNGFFGKYQQDIADLGTKLQEKVNEAFEDGLLDIDEVKEITELQSQMANMANMLAETQFESKLDLIGVQFSGAELTPETYQELQAAIQAEVDTVTKTYQDSYVDLASNLRLQLKEGYIDQAEFDTQMAYLEDQLNSQVNAIELKATNFQLQTISDTYGADLAPEAAKMVQALQEQLEFQFHAMENPNGLLGDEFNLTWLLGDAWEAVELPRETRKNVENLFNQLKPTQEELMAIADEYTAAGKAVPEGIAMGIMDIAAIGALTGDMESIYLLIGSMLSESNPKYTEMIENAWKDFGGLPEAIAKGIDMNKYLVENSGGDLLQTLKERLEQGTYANIPVKANISVSGSYTYNPSTEIPGYAAGTLAAEDVFLAGEEGPELIVGRGGSTVFPTSETEKILGSMQDRALEIDAPDLPTGRYDEYSREDRNITLELKGAGELKIGKGSSKEEVVEVLLEYIRPVLMSIMQQEIFEEGDLAYEF